MKSYNENSIIIETEDEELVFEKADVAIIRLAIDF